LKDIGIKEIKNDLKEELELYKKETLDLKNNFTIGSSKDEVKRIMGTPIYEYTNYTILFCCKP